MTKVLYEEENDDYFVSGEGGEEYDNDDPRHKYKDDMNEFSTGLGEEGMVREGRCLTDILCLAIFWAYIGAMIYATMYGYKNGEPHKLVAPIDAGLNVCGFGDMAEYPRMIFTDLDPTLLLGILKTGVCIKECPQEGGVKFKDGDNCKDNSAVKCEDAKKSYNTVDVFGFCVPQTSNALDEQDKAGIAFLRTKFAQSGPGAIFNDWYNSSRAIFYSFAMALVWCFGYIYLMSAYAEFFAWLMIILVQAGMVAVTALCYYFYDLAKIENDQQKLDVNYAALSEAEQKAFDKEHNEPQILMALLILVGGATLALICAVICARSELEAAIDVIDASSDFIAHNKRVYFVPILHFVIMVVFFILWVGAYICVISLNEMEVDSLVPQRKELKWTKQNTYLALFMFFGLLWVTAWIEYTSRFIIIVGASTYYYNNTAENTEVEEQADICYGFQCAYLHHMGSLAMGAFFIALVRFIKYMFYYAAKKMQKATGDDGVTRALVACGACCLECIEKIVDYLNESAFCYLAVTGEHFLLAAWHGFLLNLKHGLKFAFANFLAKCFIFLGKVLIVLVNIATLLLLMKFVFHDMEEMSAAGPAGPVLLVGFVTYVAASLFLGMLEKTVMAMLTAYCVDVDLNGGVAKFGPATFHDRELGSMRAGQGSKRRRKKRADDEDFMEAPSNPVE